MNVVLRRGKLLVEAADYDRFFAGLESVVLLREEAVLLILPVRFAAAGGYLVKRRNLAGDRVIDAADFFRLNRVEDEVSWTRQAAWSEERAALVVDGVF